MPLAWTERTEYLCKALMEPRASPHQPRARLLHRARTLSAFDCSAAKGEILHYFGGAGSISDLKIDEEFSDLRTQLYTLCYGKRTTH